MVRPLVDEDMAQVRTWMLAAPEAPRWADSEVMELPRANSAAREGRLRSAWGATDNHDVLIGFAVASGVALNATTAEFEVEFLFVAPARRRQGAGRLLLDSVLRWAAGWSQAEMWLEVRASNQQARGLYAAAGFEAVGVRPNYYSEPAEDAVLMHWRGGKQEGQPV